MSAQVGDRVIAIAGMKDGVCRSFGEGTYQGRQLVPDDRSWGDGHQNHCIQLDSGETVFGHECWWGGGVVYY
jgi:threonine dehydrogenase-like Zn-dependent dehydrogenase